jgi:hypothetical protein
MKKQISAILAAILIGLAPFAFATDPDTTWREAVRTGVVSNIFSVAVSMPGNATVTSNLTVSGAATITGNAVVGATNKFVVTASSGNTQIFGTLAVTGASTLTGATTVEGKSVATYQINTNANINATTVSPGIAGNLLMAPNGVVVGVITGTLAFASDATTNGWILAK